MKKVYLSLLVSFAFLFQWQYSFSQEIGEPQVRTLLKSHAPALNLSMEDVDNSVILNAYVDKVSDATLVYIQQKFNEIPVYNVVQVFAFKKDMLVSQSGSRIYRIQDRAFDQKGIPAVSARQAVVAAAQSLNLSADVIKNVSLDVLKADANNHKITFQKNALSQEPITSELFWIPGENGSVTLGWQVAILPQNSSDLWMIRINAKDGSVIARDNLTVYCNWEQPGHHSATLAPRLGLTRTMNLTQTRHQQILNGGQYKVIPYPVESMNHPGGTPVLSNNPWLLAGTTNNATSLKWHHDGTSEYNYTRGNNVWARDDIAGDNESTIGASATSTTALPNLLFDFGFDGALAPGVAPNKDFAITNLFYWNNIVHDISYQYGFDEISGNFQNSNLGRGGLQGDYVIADAQDGSGRSNANFGTGADGSKPRMQMFLFDGNPNEKVWIDIPGVYTGFISAVEGQFSTANLLRNLGPISGNIVVFNDDVAGTTHEACGTAANGSSLVGKIALIDRGNCNFVVKVKAAQNAGAVGVLVVNNVPDAPIVMGGTDNTITIPALMIFKADGDALKSYLSTKTINAVLKSPVDLDGDLDNGVIVHEYTHGISNRLTGGPSMSTCLQNNEQMGEGWSDYVALMITTNWSTAQVTDGSLSRPMGTYVISEDPVSGGGIRRYPYSTDMSVNPWTYGQLSGISGSEEHDVGEIWAATLWDMTWNIIGMSGINTNLYNANGIGGNSDALNLVILGMKLQPCSPGFLDGRDAILKADDILFNGKYHCAIWDAFARRGMGINAKQGSAYNTYDQTAGFQKPSGASITKSVDLPTVAQNGILNYTFTVKAECAPVAGFKIVDTLPANVIYVSGGSYNSGNGTVSYNVPNLAAFQTAIFTLKLKVKTGTFFADADVFSESVPSNVVPASFVATTTKPGLNWTTSATNKSAPYSLRAVSTASAAEQVLTVAAPVLINGHVQLSFWQMYNTQPGKDGGVVELSLNGTDWFDAGPYIVQNGYNASINSNSSLDGRRAFSGTNGSFVETIVNLSAFRNQSLYYRFRYVTDTTGLSNGWYLDDIVIKKKAAVYNIAKVFDAGNTAIALSDTISAITSEILPVVWSEFSVQRNGHASMIKWKTEQESNTEQFFVERSTDGVHFMSIGNAKAAGSSSAAIEYTFRDESPNPGINFYRIRLVDLDGRASYSEAKSIDFERLLAGSIVLAPNPARTYVTLSVEGNKDLLRIQITDATGRVIRKHEMKSEKMIIPVNYLTSGMYYLSIYGKNIQQVEKLIIE